MNPPLRTPLLLALWLLLVLAGGASALFTYYQAQSAQIALQLEERATATLQATAGALQAHLHNHRYHPERLEYICEHLQAIPYVVGVRIDAGGEQPLAAVGEVIQPALSGMAGNGHDAPFVRTMAFFEADEFAPGPGRRSLQRGPSPQAGWLPFPDGPVHLSVALDTTPQHQRLLGLRLQTGFAAALILLLGVLGAWILILGDRRGRLENALAVAHERSAQLDRLAQLGAGLAHETKNPLGIVRGLAQAIEHAPTTDPGVRRHAQQIVDEADRTVGQIDSFIALARPQPVAPVPVAIHAFFSHLLELVQPEAAARGVTLHHVADELCVLADEDALRRALLNLLLNALYACGPGATITLGAARTGTDARLFVQDTGAGIPAALLPQVGRPYVSGRAGGTGLGLSMVDMIASAHGWRLRIQSAEGKGTLVSLEGVTVV